MVKPLALFTAVSAAICLVGCNAGPSLVGKWKGDIPVQGRIMTANIEFTSGGKMLTTVEAQGITISGTSGYTISGDTLSTTLEDVKFTSGNLPPQLQQMVEAEVQKQKGTKETLKFKFVDADTVEVSANNQSMTWKREK